MLQVILSLRQRNKAHVGKVRYAHEHLFKNFYHGKKSLEDSERIFEDAKHANADCTGGFKPAWFYGYLDKQAHIHHPLSMVRRCYI